MIGLTGSYERVGEAAKAYRVYFSKTQARHRMRQAELGWRHCPSIVRSACLSSGKPVRCKLHSVALAASSLQDSEDDYLVDHSIITYLVNPEVRPTADLAAVAAAAAAALCRRLSCRRCCCSLCRRLSCHYCLSISAASLGPMAPPPAHLPTLARPPAQNLPHQRCAPPRSLQGKFVTFYGKNFTKEEMARNISDHVKRWQQAHPDWKQK